MPETHDDLAGKHPALLARRHDQHNAGPAPVLLAQQFLTPTDLFFVRSHAATPGIDPDSYRLVVDGLVQRPLTLSLADLAQLPRQAVTAALQCAGNRRDELLALAPIHEELPWSSDAISNADWAGIPLASILKQAGLLPGAAHVAFEGLDQVAKNGTTIPFGASIPIAKAMSPEVLLADRMNDAALPAVHGFPIRLVVPGYIGARSVKWLGRITVQAAPSQNHFQARAYKLFAPGITAETAAWEAGLMLGELSLTAAICGPTAGAELDPGPVLIQGYAMAGGGRSIARVDVSHDAGATWVQAELDQRTAWAWCLWQTHLNLGPGKHELVVRAWDSAANTQPEQLSSVWNFKGYMNTAWHRVVLLVRGQV